MNDHPIYFRVVVGEGFSNTSPLNAFDRALRDAGISSSIWRTD